MCKTHLLAFGVKLHHLLEVGGELLDLELLLLVAAPHDHRQPLQVLGGGAYPLIRARLNVIAGTNETNG